MSWVDEVLKVVKTLGAGAQVEEVVSEGLP